MPPHRIASTSQSSDRTWPSRLRQLRCSVCCQAVQHGADNVKRARSFWRPTVPSARTPPGHRLTFPRASHSPELCLASSHAHLRPFCALSGRRSVGRSFRAPTVARTHPTFVRRSGCGRFGGLRVWRDDPLVGALRAAHVHDAPEGINRLCRACSMRRMLSTMSTSVERANGRSLPPRGPPSAHHACSGK